MHIDRYNVAQRKWVSDMIDTCQVREDTNWLVFMLHSPGICGNYLKKISCLENPGENLAVENCTIERMDASCFDQGTCNFSVSDISVKLGLC